MIVIKPFISFNRWLDKVEGRTFIFLMGYMSIPMWTSFVLSERNQYLFWSVHMAIICILTLGRMYYLKFMKKKESILNKIGENQ